MVFSRQYQNQHHHVRVVVGVGLVVFINVALISVDCDLIALKPILEIKMLG